VFGLVGLALCCIWLSLNRFGRLVGVCLDELSSLLFFFLALVMWFARLSSFLTVVVLYSTFLLIKYMLSKKMLVNAEMVKD
jgi:hypothetical protein